MYFHSCRYHNSWQLTADTADSWKVNIFPLQIQTADRRSEEACMLEWCLIGWLETHDKDWNLNCPVSRNGSRGCLERCNRLQSTRLHSRKSAMDIYKLNWKTIWVHLLGFGLKLSQWVKYCRVTLRKVDL